MQHMVHLNSGRWLCRSCVAVLRGRVGRQAVEAQTTGGVKSAITPSPKSHIPGVDDASDPDWEIDPLPEATDPYDAAEVDTAPCPKCGQSVVFGVPTCDNCEIVLTDYWEEESVLHPVSRATWHHRYVVRAVIATGVVLLLYFAWPRGKESLRWEGILNEVFAGGGASLDEKNLGVAIHPSIGRVRRTLVIQNDDSFDWNDVTVKLNSTAGGRGAFSLDVGLVRAGRRHEYPLVNFEKIDGSTFTPNGVPVTRVDIQAGTPEGKAIWSAPRFVDSTAVGTLN